MHPASISPTAVNARARRRDTGIISGQPGPNHGTSPYCMAPSSGVHVQPRATTNKRISATRRMLCDTAAATVETNYNFRRRSRTMSPFEIVAILALVGFAVYRQSRVSPTMRSTPLPQAVSAMMRLCGPASGTCSRKRQPAPGSQPHISSTL